MRSGERNRRFFAAFLSLPVRFFRPSTLNESLAQAMYCKNFQDQAPFWENRTIHEANARKHFVPPTPPPPHPRADPQALAFFWPWIANSLVGDSWAVKSPGVGTKKEGKCPVLHQHYNIFHWSHSRIMPFLKCILKCDFLFQLTSSFIIALGS